LLADQNYKIHLDIALEGVEMGERTVWGIHAGKTGDADSLFLKKNFVALGWLDMGDIGKLPPDRESFKEKVRSTYPDWKLGKVPNAAGQLFRFAHEMKVGDLIVYPSKQDRHIHIGEIIGEFQYRPDLQDSYPQTRPVKWLKHVPRTAFSQGALYETGSALSFFQIKNYADEFLVQVDAKRPTLDVLPEDDTVALVTSDIEDQTRDFVLKQLSKNLKGFPLEEFVAHLLENMGYRVRLTRAGEPSVDMIAHKDDLGFEPPIIKIQVKSGDGKVSDRDVSALYGKVGGGEYGLLVTLGEFSPPAIAFANSKSNLRLIDGTELVDLVFQYYEKFDAKYKGILPLKKVYVPQTVEE
jgi:restriction system protein